MTYQNLSPLSQYMLGLAMAPLIGWTIWTLGCAVAFSASLPKGPAQLYDLDAERQKRRVGR